jgi:hypothetical protein
MKQTVKGKGASGPTLFLTLLVAAGTACTAPTEPTAPRISPEILATGTVKFYSRAVTVDYTRVPNTDQRNFPVLVGGTYDGTNGTPDLRTIANGGKVANANGYDVGFYTNSNCSTGKMKWETEQYNGQTGQVAYWVLVPTVSHTTNTVFYLCYGNVGIKNNQAQPSSVWDSNYLTVWHLADKGTLNLSNSADTKYALTNSGPVASAAGKIGGGTNKFVDSTYFLTTAGVSIPANGAVTVSMWKLILRADDFVPCGHEPPCPGPEGNHITFTLGAFHATTTSMTLWAPYFGTAYWYYSIYGPSVDFSNYYDRWVYITCVYDPAANRFKGLYLDGNLAASTDAETDGVTTSGTSKGFRLGQSYDGHGQDPSQFDEVRISKIARSADWIKTEFNNQNDPASFYALGAEVGH